MTGEPINLTALREGRRLHDTLSGTYAIPVDAFDALIDAVEAAREVSKAAGTRKPQEELREIWDDLDQLDSALERFTP